MVGWGGVFYGERKFDLVVFEVWGRWGVWCKVEFEELGWVLGWDVVERIGEGVVYL